MIDCEVVSFTGVVVLIVDDSGFSSFLVDVRTVDDGLVVSPKLVVTAGVSVLSVESSVMILGVVDNGGASVVSISSFMP